MRSILSSKFLAVALFFLVSVVFAHLSWGQQKDDNFPRPFIPMTPEEYAKIRTADSCKSIQSNYTQAIKDCSYKTEKNTQSCGTPANVNNNSDTFKMMMNTYLAANNMGGLNPEMAVGAGNSSQGTYNCDLSPRDCNQKLTDAQREIEKIQSDMQKNQEELDNLPVKLQEDLDTVERNLQSAKETYQNSRDQKTSELDRLREEANDATINAIAKERELSKQKLVASIDLKNKLQNLQTQINSMNSNLGNLDCQKKALEFKKTLGSSKNSTVGSALRSGSTKSNAISEALKACIQNFEQQKQNLMTSMNDEVTKNANLQNELQSQVDESNNRAKEKQTTFQNANARTTLQLSEAEVKYNQESIRLQNKFNTLKKKATDDEARLKNNAMMLNQKLYSKQMMISGYGTCPQSSSGNQDKTLSDLMDICNNKQDTYSQLCDSQSECSKLPDIGRYCASASSRKSQDAPKTKK